LSEVEALLAELGDSVPEAALEIARKGGLGSNGQRMVERPGYDFLPMIIAVTKSGSADERRQLIEGLQDAVESRRPGCRR
jgi:hypothetical protein